MPVRKQSAKAPQWFSDHSLAEQVALAKAHARELLTEGIDTYSRQSADLPQRVQALVARPELEQLYEGVTEDERSEIADALHAARAIGIALGLMLRSDVFTGGAR
jgi:hypothetical protein